MSNNKLLGLLFGIGIFVILHQLLPEIRCADGWDSPSIGKQGACSHHGGVEGNGIYILIILGISTWAGFWLSEKTEDWLGNSALISGAIDLVESIFSHIAEGIIFILIGLVFSSFVLFNEKAVPVLILGGIYIIVGIVKLFKN